MPQRFIIFSRACVAAAAVGLLFVLGGCGGGLLAVTGGDVLRVESLGDEPVRLSGRFDTSVYANGSSVESTFVLSDAPVSGIMDGTIRNGQIVHVELLWEPRPGWTPLAASATNVSIRYIVISDGEFGIYGGAGFAMPRGEMGDRSVTISLRDASLKLLDSTDGFVDLLTPARVSGTFTARHQPRRTREIHYALSQLVTNAFGRSMFVGSRSAGEAALVRR